MDEDGARLELAVDEAGHAEGEEVDGRAGHDLVGVQLDGEDAEDRRHRRGAGDPAEEADRDAVRALRGQHRGHRGGQHHPFDAEVDDPAALHDRLAEDREEQRRRGGDGDQDHARPPRSRELPKRIRVRITTAWPSVATVAEMFALRCSSPAPVASAPKKKAETSVASGWSCARSATAMPE